MMPESRRCCCQMRMPSWMRSLRNCAREMWWRFCRMAASTASTKSCRGGCRKRRADDCLADAVDGLRGALDSGGNHRLAVDIDSRRHQLALSLGNVDRAHGFEAGEDSRGGNR